MYQFLFFKCFYLFIWLRQVFIAARGIFLLRHSLRCSLRCMGSLLRHAGFSSCGMQVFSSLVVVQAAGCVGSVVCSRWALQLRCASSVVVAQGLSCSAACGILVPQPVIEPMSPAMEGGFFTTGPPGKSLCISFLLLLNYYKFFVLKSRCWQAPFHRLQEKIHFLAFPTFRHCPYSLAHSPLPSLKPAITALFALVITSV